MIIIGSQQGFLDPFQGLGMTGNAEIVILTP